MDDRLIIAEDLEGSRVKARCFVGFDGFTDEILDAVDVRRGPDDYEPMQSMQTFGQRILDAVGKSGNIELVSKRLKIGGQAPILTRALVEGGHAITLVGLIGEPEPLFEPLAKMCQRTIALGPSSQTLAVEFSDGKVMLGKHKSVHDVTWESLLEHIALSDLIAVHEEIDLFVSGNWTMLPGTNAIWRGFADSVVPKLSDRLRWLYVDLADPAKRSDADLVEGMGLLKQLMARYQVVLGLNVAEAHRVAEACRVEVGQDDREGIAHLASDLRRCLELAQVVIHAVDFAAAASRKEVEVVDGPGCPPILTTGGGDNFNAGYCHGLVSGYTLRQALLCGVGLSGYYVSHGHSPTWPALATFMRLWHDSPDGLSAALPIQDAP